MPDTWRCVCGYTNLGTKTCIVCRRPRQAIPPPRPDPVEELAPAEAPAQPKGAKKSAKRPSRTAAKKQPAPRKRAR